jgi:TonB family protein
VRHDVVPIIFLLCTLLFGQNSPSAGASAPPAPPAPPASPAASQADGERRTNVSGFEGRYNEDLGFYPSQVLAKVRARWYPQIPDLQKSIGKKQGTTVIEFEIKHDGSLRKVRTIQSSGDISMDATASQAISSAAPFDRLPGAYKGNLLVMRMHFGYGQPRSAEAPMCDGPNWGAHPMPKMVVRQVGRGVTPPKATFSPDPEYSEQARKAAYASAAWIAGTVDPEGHFSDLCLTQAAGSGLDEKAMEAVRKWKFEPARLDGQPVSVRIVVEVDFRLY